MRRLSHLKSKKHLLAAPYAAWAVIFIVVPLCMILYYGITDKQGAFTAENILAIASPGHARALWRSVLLSFVSTVICFLLAYPLAMILAAKKENNGSVINSVLAFLGLPAMHMINTSSAIVLGMVYNFLPFMVLPLYNALSKIDDNVIHAAKDLGANKIQSFLHIILPLSVPGIISGVTMVFVPALTTFVISTLLGGSKVLLIGNVIEQEFTQASNWHLGSGLSIVLMIFILLNMVVTALLEKEET